MSTLYDRRNKEQVLRNITQKIADLPVLPVVVTTVMGLISDPDTTVKKLEEVIRTDQSLAVKVLKMSNSAFYGFSRQISSIEQAVKILGFNTLRSILVSSSAAALFADGSDEEAEFHQELWEHSLLTATICRLIASRGPMRFLGEELFTAGLLHDFGKKIINRHFPGIYQKVEIMAEQKGVSEITIEMEALGFNHAEVGSLMANSWSLPPALTEAILRHHNPEWSEQFTRYVSTVSLADMMAHLHGEGRFSDPEVIMSLTGSFRLNQVDLDERQFTELIREIDEAYEAERSNFDDISASFNSGK
ncbi:MAG: hypothetical protein CVV64_03535 [Candidatus Wallbacteria bacterium HGW-Wallbacteria-1]|jgi:putative nucleotidyltransferase with HDIG domain|uniref:HDOD domain-containing protein n=1 Tax=Candidatus Wallbacteria bacterium HGW-Wallbacteria-1 TaxID=2013854 RepID=A0A2N1PTS3_9BACT|nr:MAG: hypothetical protein CVV64_03535 [Candidatus Wallbacteria bacterium HGW-Wallbacteria-1]